MFIKYNRPNVHIIPGLDGTKGHKLIPGWNEFPTAVWEKYKDHPELKGFVEDGIIEFLDAQKVEKKGKKTVKTLIGKDDSPVELKDLPEAKAIQVAKETVNRDLLERWYDAETRTKVKKELAKQLEPLRNVKSEGNQK